MEPGVFQQKVTYTRENGAEATINLPLLDIPSGTLLFRGVKLPDITKDEDPRTFVKEFLGYPEAGRFCLPPTFMTFFYPFPYAPFGAHTVGDWFNAIEIYVLVKNVRLVCMVSPSKWIRGEPNEKSKRDADKIFNGNAPIQRCNKMVEQFPQTCQHKRREEGLKWDNCIHPNFAKESGVNGWMAIADYDSLDNFNVPGTPTTNTTMGKYILELNTRNPQAATQLLAEMYADNRRHRGIPEIVLYPWSPHPGGENQLTDAENEEEAAEAISAMSDRFVYLPVACITAKGILEAFSGTYTLSDLPEGAAREMSGPAVRAEIDRLQTEYLNKLKTEGVEIEGLGNAKMVFDSRTGFYMLDIFKPDDVSFPDQEGNIVPYPSLLFPMTTEDERKKVLEYQILLRSLFRDQYMQRLLLHDGTPVRRAFVLERPPIFRTMFDDLRLRIPPEMQQYVRGAAALYQANRARLNATRRAAAAAKGGKRFTRKTQRGGDNAEGIPAAFAEAEDTSNSVDIMVNDYLSSTYQNLWKSWIQKRV